MTESTSTEPTPRVLAMTQLMTPDMVNFSGKIHGGSLLKILDEVAFTCAARYTGRYVVTLLVDDVRFRAPVHVGELVTFLASVNWVGRTSLEVGIRVVAENYRTGSSRHVISCFFVMVAMDDDGRPREVTKFTPANEVEQRRWADAERRQETLRAAREARDGEPEVDVVRVRPRGHDLFATIDELLQHRGVGEFDAQYLAAICLDFDEFLIAQRVCRLRNQTAYIRQCLEFLQVLFLAARQQRIGNTGGRKRDRIVFARKAGIRFQHDQFVFEQRYRAAEFAKLSRV